MPAGPDHTTKHLDPSRPIMNRHLPLTTNLLPSRAAVFCRVSSQRSGLLLAQRPSSNAVRHHWLDANDDQVHPGEGAT